MTIPIGLDRQVVQVIRRRKQDIRDLETNSGSVQILERMVGECRNQLVTLAEDGMKSCNNVEIKQSERRQVRIGKSFEGRLGNNT